MNLQQDTLRDAMLDPEFYPDPVDHVELIETHISQVFLTGQYAYKIKKPVNFGFLDFSELKRRKFYCEEELRLNGRLAPDVYLDVIPITRSDNSIKFNGDGDIIEYAIKMKQFPQQGLLSHLVEKDQLTKEQITELAEVIAEFHQNIEKLGNSSDIGTASEILKPVNHNFEILQPLLDAAQQEKLNKIRKESLSLHQQIKTFLEERKQLGFIRECHGDLHLGNIALINNHVTAFDGIEFNDSFRWIDTISEIAFLTMDLDDHQQSTYATIFLNHYLEITGDYEGLTTLTFYKIYRAMVRAKVVGLRRTQLKSDCDEYNQDTKELNNYLQLAERYCNTEKGNIIITHGISGSGKSWLATRLRNQIRAIHISSDRERKRRYMNTKTDLYSQETTDKVYHSLAKISEHIIESGYNALVDATFLNPEYRHQFEQLATKLNCKLIILNCKTDKSLLEARIKKRRIDNNNLSDADISIMHKQLESYLPLQENELNHVITIDYSEELDLDKIIKDIKQKTA